MIITWLVSYRLFNSRGQLRGKIQRARGKYPRKHLAMLLSYFRVNLEEHYFFSCSLYLHHGKSQENGKRLRDSWWKWGVTWLRRGVKFFPAKNEQTSVKMSAKLHSETLVELLGRLGISQWMFFHRCHRGISLSTFQMKCTLFQCSPPRTVVWDSSPICLPWTWRCRAPGHLRVWTNSESKTAASRLLSLELGTCSIQQHCFVIKGLQAPCGPALWGCWLLPAVGQPWVPCPSNLGLGSSNLWCCYDLLFKLLMEVLEFQFGSEVWYFPTPQNFMSWPSAYFFVVVDRWKSKSIITWLWEENWELRS